MSGLSHGDLGRIGGILFAAATLAMIPAEYTGSTVAYATAGVCTVLGLAAFFGRVTWSRRVYVLIGVALLVLCIALLSEWQGVAWRAVKQAAFITGFFTALTAIRSAASGSPAIAECGRFLAGQPPGRRYLALTLGGHLFGLVLSYGALTLLGGLATESVAKETDAELRGHRARRMLLAIQRGFVSCLTWSPLGFAMVISSSVVPGARWSDVIVVCLGSTALLVGIGWALDTAFKPRLSQPAPSRGPAEGRWIRNLRPLLILLGILFASVAGIHVLTDVRVVGVVLSVAPVIALVWAVLQPAAPGAGAHLRHAGRRAGGFVTAELPLYGSEMVLLIMAAVIGTLGSALLAPVVAASGLDLGQVPVPLMLIAIVWLIPVAGQLGMNPILAVSLFAPLLPTPEAMGIAPAAVIVAMTGGWAISGATSPFTASTLLIAKMGQVSAVHAGVRWNGAYAVCSAIAISGWAILVAWML
ncbi:hypothetical protein [Oceaniglobus indicus]|uniref:hypothetical protein n=1 Tax=Oceaniglobus indicus TaxID=2047749 RepID=UPI000C18EA2B|nr:hypothetical protein [Oceaniglobus indicus]